MGERLENHPAPASGGRLDQVLLSLYPEESRSQLQRWIQLGRVSVDGRLSTKSGAPVRRGQWITVRIPPSVPAVDAPEAIPLAIVYEDDDVIVIDKPPGMVVHPSAGHASGTLVNAVLGHAPGLAGIGGERRPGIVHRLDRDTSGLLIVAKNEAALRVLQDQFRDRSVEKIYLALVDGGPPDRRGRVEAAIGRDPRHRQRMAVVPESRGRAAATEYRVRAAYPRHALLEAAPQSGRTHQIRVHLAFLGCPVVGDRVYGARRPGLDVDRQMLHAWRLTLKLPGSASVRQFEAPMPTDMAQAIERARVL